jgi:RNA recognition motif-containing protein
MAGGYSGNVDLTSPKPARTCTKFDATPFDGRRVAAEPSPLASNRSVIIVASKLYVGNLSFRTTEDSLREAFSASGQNVTRVSIVMDRETGRSRGFAFVETASDEDARAIIQAWDGQDLDGRALRVNEAREREGGGGGRGGGFGGGFGGGGGRGGFGGGGGRGGFGGGGRDFSGRGGRGGGGGRSFGDDDRY